MKDNWHWFIFGAICGGIVAFALTVLFLPPKTAYVERPVEVVRETTVYKFPNIAFSDPIDLTQALLLLNNMRASHEQVLNWTFTSDPGFGIADKEFQNLCIKEYDQLIDFVWRQAALKNSSVLTKTP